MSSTLPPESPLPKGDQHPKTPGATTLRFPRWGRHEHFKKLPLSHRIIFLVMTSLILVSSLFGGVAYGVYAASQPVKLPIKEAKTTVQQFLQQAAAAKGSIPLRGT